MGVNAVWGTFRVGSTFHPTLPIPPPPASHSDSFFLCPNYIPKPARRACTQASFGCIGLAWLGWIGWIGLVGLSWFGLVGWIGLAGLVGWVRLSWLVGLVG